MVLVLVFLNTSNSSRVTESLTAIVKVSYNLPANLVPWVGRASSTTNAFAFIYTKHAWADCCCSKEPNNTLEAEGLLGPSVYR